VLLLDVAGQGLRHQLRVASPRETAHADVIAVVDEAGCVVGGHQPGAQARVQDARNRAQHQKSLLCNFRKLGFTLIFAAIDVRHWSKRLFLCTVFE